MLVGQVTLIDLSRTTINFRRRLHLNLLIILFSPSPQCVNTPNPQPPTLPLYPTPFFAQRFLFISLDSPFFFHKSSVNGPAFGE